MLFHDQVIKWRIAKVLVYSDSVLCLGKVSDHSEANRRWEGQVADFQLSASCEELLGRDGEPIELEWNTFTGLTSLQILQRIQNHLEKRNIEPENFGDRIIFMSMFNDIEWTRKGNEGNPEKFERKRNHTLQGGCLEHRTLIPNYSFSEAAQYPRSSLRLE